MKHQLYLFVGVFFLLVTLFSCQEDVENLDDDINATLVPTTKSVRDIDGGRLPEVVVFASYRDGNDGGGGGDNGDWWHPFPLGSGGGGSVYPEGGGGGGAITPPPLTVTLVKNLLDLFPKGSDLSKADLEKLNVEYKKMLNSCEYMALNNYLLTNNYLGGKVKMKPADVPGLVSIDTNGTLTFYGSESVDATNLCHEWIHMCQQTLKPEACKHNLPENEGMMEFEVAFFQDVMRYIKYGAIFGEEGVSRFPNSTSWASNLIGIDNAKLQIIYAAWIATTFPNRKIPKTIKDRLNYEVFCNAFFRYNIAYKNREFKYNYEYGVSSLEKMLNTVAEKCFK